MLDKNNRNTQSIEHDINSALSAVMGAIEVVNEEWRKNPELVDKILPLTIDKIKELENKLKLYRNQSP